MDNIFTLSIDNYPRVDYPFLYTEYSINKEEEISISINNFIIFGKDDIVSINDNIIEFPDNIKFTKKDNIVVIYNKI